MYIHHKKEEIILYFSSLMRVRGSDKASLKSGFKKSIFLAILLLSACILPLPAQNTAPSLSIIPEPVRTEAGTGNFVLTSATTIRILANEEGAGNVAQYLAAKLRPATGFNLKISEESAPKSIQLQLNQQQDPEIGEEGYHLDVSPEKILISANKPAGLFYGVQTLLQLLPKETENNHPVKNVKWQVPAVKITDYPRFGWRGLMLDVSRHFFPKKVVKDYIDQMARYKFNRFHWHLTDDQGWRIEIKSLPKLTETGAWRVPRHGKWGTHEPPKPGEKATDGGFYTQKDIKEIVQYAKERYIEVLPEIDVPGHSMAAIAAYPWLSVTKDSSTRVNPGSNFATWHGHGKFTMHIDNNLDPSNEKVYDFLDRVFTEVAALFPFEYIHMGGDEAYKGYWEKDPEVKALMKKEKLKDAHEVQSYFVKRVNEIIRSKGKKMIGWNEIMEGGLAPGAAVMSWQNVQPGIEATKLKAPVVMSPSPMAYLDLYQGDPSVEPPTYSMARLKDSYHWDPLPTGADSAYVLGGQGNLWTEQVPSKPQIEYMIWPRALALSEVFWSPKQKKNWSNFTNKTAHHFERFDAAGINYARSMYDPIIKVSKNKKGNLVIDLTTESEGMDLYYTLDNTLPNKYYSRYEKPIVVPEGTDLFRVISYKNGKAAGKMISLTFEELEKRVKK